MSCKRKSGKGEGHNLTYWGLTFLPLDAAAPLINMEENIKEFSWRLSTLLTS